MSAGQSTEHLRNYSVMDPDAKKYGRAGSSSPSTKTIPSFNVSEIIFATEE